MTTSAAPANPGASTGRTGQPPRPNLLWSCGRAFCRIATTLLFDLQLRGIHNVPVTGGALLISNHQSYIDPILLAVQLPRMVSFMARSNLFDNQYFGWLIRGLNAFPVRRGESDISALKEALRRLAAGDVLTMFPEGTRTHDGEIGRIQPGIAMLVRRARVPVVPAVINGSFQAWPRGQKLPHPHPIRVMYGPPMHVAGLKGHEIVDLIDRTLRSMLVELRGGNPPLKPS